MNVKEVVRSSNTFKINSFQSQGDYKISPLEIVNKKINYQEWRYRVILENIGGEPVSPMKSVETPICKMVGKTLVEI